MLAVAEKVAQPPVLVRIVVKGDDAREPLLQALGAAARAHPGDAPVVVLLAIEGEGEARISTSLRMARTREAWGALERLEGAGGLTLVRN